MGESIGESLDGKWRNVIAGPAKRHAWLVVFGVGVFFTIALSLLFLFTIKNIIFYIFFAIVLSAALRPWVLLLRRKLPYGLALATVYLSILGILFLALTLIIPVVVFEVSNLIISIPQLVQSVQPTLDSFVVFSNEFGVVFDISGQIRDLLGQVTSLLPNVIALPGKVFGVYMAVFSVFALSFYWLLGRDQMISSFISFLPEERRGTLLEFIDLTEHRLGAYVSGLLLVSAVVGVMTFIGLSVLGVKYSLLLAVFAAGLEVIPIMGPIIAAIPIFLVSASQSLLLGGITLAFFIVVQQLEGYVIMPIVQERAISLNPFIILVAILVGGSLAGITGALLAIPIALTLATVLDELRKYR